MPAGIAVKVNHAKLNTQETGTVKKAVKAADEKSDGKSAEKTVNSDFKKLLDKKIGKTDIKAVDKNGDKKLSEKGVKLSSEKLSEIQSASVQNPDKIAEKSEADNIINFETEIDSQIVPVNKKETADKNSQLVSAAFQDITKLSAADGKKSQAADSGKGKLENIGKDSEKISGEDKEDVRLKVLDLRSNEKSDKKGDSSSFNFDSSNEKIDLNNESSEQKNDSSMNQLKDSLVIKADAGDSLKTDAPVKSLTAQQTEVLEKLKSDGNSEIVKQTKIILNDNNSGELKMVLRPEKLGFVRIKLNLDDNNIVGRIIVDNNNIKEIFENNMDNLLKSFRESGFGSASLEVSVGGGKNQQQNMNSNDRFFSKKIIEEIDNHNIISRVFSDDSLIDLVV